MISLSNLFERSKKFSNPSMKIHPESIYSKEEFHMILTREYILSDRYGLCFSVAVFQLGQKTVPKSVGLLVKYLKKRIRLTDELGWFDNNSIGVFLSNTNADGAWRLVNKVKTDMNTNNTTTGCTVYTYPNQWFKVDADMGEPDNYSQDNSSQLVNDEKMKRQSKDLFREMPLSLPLWKKGLDVFGALVGLILLLPLFLLIAILIKIVSPGPVFFKQERIGYGGKLFIFWKFRTMKVDVDTSAHQKLWAGLINSTTGDKPMTKLDDKEQRIPFGKILRATCLDELPQLINVIRGEMSLVGPRPPIPYEAQKYQSWHRGRFTALPGITGLWQVSGKNRLSFNEMVRLDIKYARQQSLLLDIKILLLTPSAVLLQVMDSLFGHPLEARRKVS